MSWDRPLFYDRAGKGLTVEEFKRLYTGPDRVDRITVGRTQIGYVQISTVWLGVDYSLGGDVPVIYESMTFARHDRNLDCELWGRYSSEQEAWYGHQVICRAVLEYLTARQLEAS